MTAETHSLQEQAQTLAAGIATQAPTDVTATFNPNYTARNEVPDILAAVEAMRS